MRSGNESHRSTSTAVRLLMVTSQPTSDERRRLVGASHPLRRPWTHVGPTSWVRGAIAAHDLPQPHDPGARRTHAARLYQLLEIEQPGLVDTTCSRSLLHEASFSCAIPWEVSGLQPTRAPITTAARAQVLGACPRLRVVTSMHGCGPPCT